uniref:Uncharacterized protein n=1 Tax=Gouania willdenowi TaxID=441366 RepID=A0A8C5GIU4_GOUWI
MCCLSLGTSEHHFLCSICLEVLTDPVTTPCGHNFCKTCISTHWDTSTTSRCPVCLRRHQLVEPVENLESRMCPKHSKPLELFCQSDQTRVCLMCSVLEHRSHQLVPLGEDLFEDKKVYLQQMIQKRREKLEAIRESVRFRKEAADRGKAEGVEVFTALMELVERGLKELMKTMEEQQEAEEREAEGLIKELEEEIFELMKRSSEVEQLSHSEDHLLQHFCSLKAPPATKDWTEVMVHPSSHEGTVLRAVMMKMKMMQQFAVDVTLDPLTANPYLVLSDDGKQVYCSDKKELYPDHQDRFDSYQVLCSTGLTGRCYWEVERNGDVNIAVSYRGIRRKGNSDDCWFGFNNQSWRLKCYRGFYIFRHNNKVTHTSCPCGSSSRVGVYVDCPDGRLSFYEVSSDSLTLIHTVCTSFTDTLYPGFWIGFGSSVSLSPL